MTKICICDLDGVICDSTARFAKAEEAKAAYKREAELTGNIIVGEETKIFWRTAFTPSLVELDTLIDGVVLAIEALWSHDYHVSFLTSRPESMREATVQWLEKHGFIFAATDLSKYLNDDPMGIDHLIMKPASAQFVKTVVWKSLTVEMLVRLFGVDDLMVIDDEQAIQEAIAALDLPCDRKIGGNLQEALAML